MGINPKLASDFSCWFEDRFEGDKPLPEEVSGIDLDNTLWGESSGRTV